MGKILKKYLLTFVLLITFFVPFLAFANGTISGTFKGVDRYTGAYLIETASGTVIVPKSTSFEGGAVNTYAYTCSYVGTLNKITSADCKLKTAALKGNLNATGGGYQIVDINDKNNVIATLPAGTNFTNGKTSGGYYICNYSGTLPNIQNVTCTMDRAASPAIDKSKNVTFNLFPDLVCSNDEALSCWVGYVYNWSQGAILLLSVGAFVAAGLIYMTSTGNPKQVLLAKKLIFGALSAIAIIVLGRFFLVNVVGVSWL